MVNKNNLQKRKKLIKEFRCKCKQCGHVWHYLPEEEKRANSNVLWNSCGMMSCCLPFQIFSKNQADNWQNTLDKFKKCPKCGSTNIIKKEIQHEMSK